MLLQLAEKSTETWLAALGHLAAPASVVGLGDVNGFKPPSGYPEATLRPPGSQPVATRKPP
jgi:hypothetical protein